MATATCERCGRTGEPTSLEWSSTVRDGVPRPLCGPCTRLHLRDIEGKLDESWWTPTERPVLVVEDDMDTRLLIRMALESAGHLVDEASTGEDALQRLAAGPVPMAVVVDIRLPGTVDGWVVCERAQGLPEPPPVVVISSTSTVANDARAADIDHLHKPFEMERLVELIARRSGDQAGAGLA